MSNKRQLPKATAADRFHVVLCGPPRTPTAPFHVLGVWRTDHQDQALLLAERLNNDRLAHGREELISVTDQFAGSVIYSEPAEAAS